MQDLVQKILDVCGGPANIVRSGNCMTRLRLAVKNDAQVSKDALKALPGVLGLLESEGQLQIVLGPGKAQRAADAMQVLLEKAGNAPVSETNASKAAPTLEEVAAANKKAMKSTQTDALRKFLQTFATIFTPLIPGFIAAGLLLGIATLVEQTMVKGVPPEAVSQTLLSLILYMKVFAKGLFTFLGILVGYNTQQAFGGSGVNGAIIGALFILSYNPEVKGPLQSGLVDFFGLTIDPRGNIIGILIACIIGASIEKQIRRRMPDSLDMQLTSLLTLMITGALTYALIMPLGFQLFTGMSWLFQHLSGNPLGTAVLAGVFLLAVMFGVHQGFVPIYLALMDSQGFNSLFPVLAMAGGGQVGAAIALYLRAKAGSVTRNQISGAIIPGFLGVGEPLIYGVTLPRVKPFVTACFGGAAGGFVMGLFAYLGKPVGLNAAFGPSGLLAIPMMTAAESNVVLGMGVYILGILTAYVGGFAFTWLWGSKNVDLS